MARLRSLPQHTVRVRHQTSHSPGNPTATGSDGYRATMAWAEPDPAFSGKKILGRARMLTSPAWWPRHCPPRPGLVQ